MIKTLLLLTLLALAATAQAQTDPYSCDLAKCDQAHLMRSYAVTVTEPMPVGSVLLRVTNECVWPITMRAGLYRADGTLVVDARPAPFKAARENVTATLTRNVDVLPGNYFVAGVWWHSTGTNATPAPKQIKP